MKLQLKPMLRALFGTVLFLAITIPAAEAVVIYPTPQHNGMRSVTTRVNDVQVIMRDQESKGGMWDRLPDIPEGYAVDITPGKVTVYANDEAGVYYALLI